ncbi:TraB/GumN family protein [Aliikangiella marina]|nr:TraB/GumN family protein [Aliikangiella marina]
MKKTLSLILLTFIFSSTVCFAKGPALWKISDENSEVWLFGTIHILKPETLWQTDKIKHAFEQADTVYLEAPTEEITQEEMFKVMLPYIQNPNGVMLSSLISKEAYEDLKVAVEGLGMPSSALASLEPMRPWFVAVNLSVQHLVANGYDPESGVDGILYTQAKQSGKTLRYFETIEQQIRFFGTMSANEEVAMFEAGIPDLLENQSMLDEIIKNWQRGDVEAVAKTLNEEMDKTPTLKERLLVNRNQDWAKQIAKIMKGSGKTFIAVGSGHLAGEGSLQAFLTAKGFEIKRL